MQGVVAQEVGVEESVADAVQVEGQEQIGAGVQHAGELTDELAAAQSRAARLEQELAAAVVRNKHMCGGVCAAAWGVTVITGWG